MLKYIGRIEAVLYNLVWAVCVTWLVIALFLKQSLNHLLVVNSLPELAHVNSLGFNSCSFNEPDFFIFIATNTLLDDSSSFSAGGPGKGMYSWLYLDVAGLFCIYGSSAPSDLDWLKQQHLM